MTFPEEEKKVVLLYGLAWPDSFILLSLKLLLGVHKQEAIIVSEQLLHILFQNNWKN